MTESHSNDIFVQNDEPIRFWVALGPHRRKIRQDIESHGGAVVSSEIQAHYILSDTYSSARKRPAFHFRYIQDCIDQQDLLNMDEYLLAPSIKKGEYKEPRGRTRVPFTKEEDRLLAEYLRGIDQGRWQGIRIYEDFAEKNPTHSAQSWRERAKKRIIPQIRHVLSNSNQHNQRRSPSPQRPQQEESDQSDQESAVSPSLPQKDFNQSRMDVRAVVSNLEEDAQYNEYVSLFEETCNTKGVEPSDLYRALFMTSGLFKPAIELLENEFALENVSPEMRRYIYTSQDDEDIRGGMLNVYRKANVVDRISFLSSGLMDSA